MFNLNTHFLVTVGDKSFGKFQGKILLDGEDGYMPVLGRDFTGTPEEIMRRVKLETAQILAKAELESDLNYQYNEEIFKKRIEELAKI